MIKLLTLSVLVLTGCLTTAGQEAPQLPDLTNKTVRLSGALNDDILMAADSWAQVGFTFVTDPADLEIRIKRVDDNWGPGGPGGSNHVAGVIYLDSKLYADRADLMTITMAHQLGHVLLVTTDHLGPGLGVMSEEPTDIELTSADVAFTRDHLRPKTTEL